LLLVPFADPGSDFGQFEFAASAELVAGHAVGAAVVDPAFAHAEYLGELGSVEVGFGVGGPSEWDYLPGLLAHTASSNWTGAVNALSISVRVNWTFRVTSIAAAFPNVRKMSVSGSMNRDQVTVIPFPRIS
jgi:hypothetical protein